MKRPATRTGRSFAPRLGSAGLEVRVMPSVAAPSVRAAEDVAGPIPLTMGKNAHPEAISTHANGVLQDILRQSGELDGAKVTSTARTPRDQARIMFDEARNGRGPGYLHDLYAAPGDKVTDVYEEMTAKHKSNPDILEAMEKTIKKLGPSKVSRHAADPGEGSVVDIAPSSIKNKKAFIAAVKEAQRKGLIKKFLQPPKDNAYHLEIAPAYGPPEAPGPLPGPTLAPGDLRLSRNTFLLEAVEGGPDPAAVGFVATNAGAPGTLVGLQVFSLDLPNLRFAIANDVLGGGQSTSAAVSASIAGLRSGVYMATFMARNAIDGRLSIGVVQLVIHPSGSNPPPGGDGSDPGPGDPPPSGTATTYTITSSGNFSDGPFYGAAGFPSTIVARPGQDAAGAVAEGFSSFFTAEAEKFRAQLKNGEQMAPGGRTVVLSDVTNDGGVLRGRYSSSGGSGASAYTYSGSFTASPA